MIGEWSRDGRAEHVLEEVVAAFPENADAEPRDNVPIDGIAAASLNKNARAWNAGAPDRLADCS
jgi:hypothetical protein